MIKPWEPIVGVCCVLCVGRAASLCRVLPASVWNPNPGHRAGDGRQNTDWHMFWRHLHIVRLQCLQLFDGSLVSVPTLIDISCICLNVCAQQRCRSWLSASRRAVQLLCDGGPPPGGSRTQKNQPPGGLAGMLLGEKDPCCLRVCNPLWTGFQRRTRATWEFDAARVS